MARRTVHLLDGVHLTATDKRHILALVDKGWQHGSTRRKSYAITERTDDTLRLTIESRVSDDFGRPQTRRQCVTVEIRGGACHV